jgi:hypothetical protein
MNKGGIAQLLHLTPVLHQPWQGDILPDIQQVVGSFSELFQEPTDLPPQLQLDHHIPLIPGAVLVNVKLYHYSPSQKDEIEHQLKEMLKHGIIQPNVSPFASPVLLVKKKDSSWRFCVDYRRLNALTVKINIPCLLWKSC